MVRACSVSTFVCAIMSDFWCRYASWCRVVWVERGQLQIPIQGSFELIEREPIARQSSLGSHWYQCSRSDAEILLSSARLLLWHPMDQPQWWGHWSQLKIYIFGHKWVALACSIEPSPLIGSTICCIGGICPHLFSAILSHKMKMTLNDYRKFGFPKVSAKPFLCLPHLGGLLEKNWAACSWFP